MSKYMIGILVLALLAAAGTAKHFAGELGEAQTKIGTLEAAYDGAVAISNENVKAFEEERTSLLELLAAQRLLRDLADKAAVDAREREANNRRALTSALNTIKEIGNANPEWALVPIPDAVVDGMQCSSARATGQAQDCPGGEAFAGGDPGAPAQPVPDH